MPLELALWYAPQLSAAAAMLNLAGSSGGPETAAVAADIAEPAVLLPWLRGVSDALDNIPTDADSPSGAAAEQMLLDYQKCLGCLLWQPCWSSHAEAIAADAALQAAIARVLLQRALPTLAADVSENGVNMLLQLLASSQLSTAVRQLLQQPGASSQAAAALHRVMTALPDQQPTGKDSSQLARLWVAVTTLAAGLLVHVQPRHPTGSRSAIASDGSDGDCGSASMARAAAWGQVAAQLLCTLAAALPHLISTAGGQVVYPAMAGICLNACALLETWGDMDRRPIFAGTYAAWVEAATAGLRLQPALSRLEGEFCRLQLGSLEHVPHLFLKELRALLEDGIRPLAETPGGAAQEAAAATLLQLLQLHSLACRLCHWLAGSGRQAGGGRLTELGCRWMQSVLDGMVQAAAEAYMLTGDGPLTDRTVRALSVAHLEATQALWAAASSVPAAESSGGLLWDAVAAQLGALGYVAQACPAVVNATFLQPIQTALASLEQDAAQLDELARFLTYLADACTSPPPLACSLVCTGLLATALDCADQLVAGGGGSAAEKAGALLHNLTSCLESLAAAPELVDSSAARKLARQAAAAQSRLGEQVATLPAEAAPAERAQQLRQLLPAAERLAAVFDAYCQLPSQRAAQRLELARAAAGRSCAYLRCSNMQAEGSPLVCKGHVGMRCSACHVAWYCSTACSHADWREGGHRRVCKLLGEERRRRKAAQALAPEE